MNEQTQRWREQYESERDRLIDALGRVVEGGILEAIQHIGATSVPDLYGSTSIDIGLAVWPFPLESEPRSRLEALRYQLVSGYEGSPEQRFRHESNQFVLYLAEPGSQRWSDFILTRDYLRHNQVPRQAFSLQKQNAVLDKSHLFKNLLPAAHNWWIEHYQFSPVEAVANELNRIISLSTRHRSKQQPIRRRASGP